MSHALQALSLPENKHIQERLRAEILALGLPTDHTHALTSEQLNSIMKSPYIDAVVRETLRLYPPHTTHIHRVTPPGGRVLDGFYLPENTKVGTSAYIVHMNGDVFGSEVGQWRPERWLVDDTEQVRKMEHTLWAFGSGSRGCVGKK
jgi:cytochrome P450